MANFFEVTKRMSTNCFGVVNGSDFTTSKSPQAYIGFEQIKSGLFPKYNTNKLMIYGVGIDDYFFEKKDIESWKECNTNATFAWGRDDIKCGTQYQLVFKDGKKCLVTIPSNDTGKLTNAIL